MPRMLPALAIATAFLAAGCGIGEALGLTGLAGDWTITTTPSISGSGGRGQPTKPMPIALKLTSGQTPLAGTMTMWKGDYQASDAVTGTFEGGKIVLKTASYTFNGTYDAATKVATGTVVETPSGEPAAGTKTTFRMAR